MCQLSKCQQPTLQLLRISERVQQVLLPVQASPNKSTHSKFSNLKCGCKSPCGTEQGFQALVLHVPVSGQSDPSDQQWVVQGYLENKQDRGPWGPGLGTPAIDTLCRSDLPYLSNGLMKLEKWVKGFWRLCRKLGLWQETGGLKWKRDEAIVTHSITLSFQVQPLSPSVIVGPQWFQSSSKAQQKINLSRFTFLIFSLLVGFILF